MDILPHTQDAQQASCLSTSGAAIRDTAVAALARRHAVLVERSKRRQLTGAERTEIDRLSVVIDTLQSMGSA